MKKIGLHERTRIKIEEQEKELGRPLTISERNRIKDDVVDQMYVEFSVPAASPEGSPPAPPQ